MMPVLREILRDSLKTGVSTRLGTVRCVSAKRGWWTKDVKADISRNGGACWMVGKVNVGKSNLFEAVFPKGSNDEPNFSKIKSQAKTLESKTESPQRFPAPVDDISQHESSPDLQQTFSPIGSSEEISAPDSAQAELAFQPPSLRDHEHSESDSALSEYDPMRTDHEAEPSASQEPLIQADRFGEIDDINYLLPPAQTPMKYPVMPVISELPGTTAAPIRVPFGNGKGELIDLPGLKRSDFATYVQPEFHAELIMKSRITPERIVIKPGQSLLLGGIIRITPKTPDQIFMAHCFVPDALRPHLTSTPNAIKYQSGERPARGVKIVTETSKMQTVQTAGTYKLQWDVTRQQTGPLTRSDDVKLKPAQLPFVVFATDILVEGCGWIEVVAQLRRKKTERGALSAFGLSGEATMPDPPEIEVFTPAGRFIGQRRPLNCWLVGKPKESDSNKKRPRRSMALMKARAKGQAKL